MLIKKMSKTWNYILQSIFLVLILIENLACEQNVEVKINQGVLLGGKKKTFWNEKEYVSFKGIPYAEPPVGELRFQAPKPLLSWEGSYEAYENKPTCVQYSTKTRNNEEFGLSGSEDCLYLSVYTPGLTGSYPVVVFDFNDNFRTGFNGSDTYSPDFFLEEDVIVITITHRLGIFGYLTTEDDVIPANNGIRDFILGLQWVQDNIKEFGGDSTRVTLMGNRGGSILMNLLLYSEKANGLFSGAILQSGSALEINHFCQNPKIKAFELGEQFDLKTEDSKELLEKLQNVEVDKLIEHEHMIFEREDLQDKQYSVYPFAPVIESDNEDVIINAFPETWKIASDVPVIIGLTSREGLDTMSLFLRNPKMFIEGLKNLALTLPIRVNFKFDRESNVYHEHIVKEINDMYYKDGYVHSQNAIEYSVFIGDVSLSYAIDKNAKTLAHTLESPVYYYLFDFRGVLNENIDIISRYSAYSIGPYGATVTDDLCYLHLCSRIIKTYENLKKLVSEQIEIKVLKKMVRLWTNFIKTGTPTQEQEDGLLKGINWKPINKDEEKAKFLHISKKFTMRKEPLKTRAAFWDQFLDKYSKMALDGIVTDSEDEKAKTTKVDTQNNIDKKEEQKEINNNDKHDEEDIKVTNVDTSKSQMASEDIPAEHKVVVVDNNPEMEYVPLPFEALRNEL